MSIKHVLIAILVSLLSIHIQSITVEEQYTTYPYPNDITVYKDLYATMAPKNILQAPSHLSGK